MAHACLVSDAAGGSSLGPASRTAFRNYHPQDPKVTPEMLQNWVFMIVQAVVVGSLVILASTTRRLFVDRAATPVASGRRTQRVAVTITLLHLNP